MIPNARIEWRYGSTNRSEHKEDEKINFLDKPSFSKPISILYNDTPQRPRSGALFCDSEE
jgi:hypothetical protein